MLFIFRIVSLLLLMSIVHADNGAMNITKNKLKQLESKMNLLQHHISRAHTKQSALQQELNHTEKNINTGAMELKKIKLAMVNTQHQITLLQQQVTESRQQLQASQHLLTEHVRARYKMGEYQPMKWLINQDNPDKINRLLTFYQYLVRSRLRVMDDVEKTTKSLSLSQEKLNQELLLQKNLTQQLNMRQHALELDIRHRTTLIHSLAHDIQVKQDALKACQRNKNNLSRLLNKLVQQSVLQTRHPITRMRRKLPKPVLNSSQGRKKINQGVVFFSPEGSPVVAVYPGKVVFADWLNGYGLLLIIDHGWGFMTLYGNNKSLLKHVGNSINQGEKIALVGHSGTLKENGLYFEIRQRGKAVNPLEWMP